ncbi:MAG: amidohydrolase family protein [Ilumatobacteraceae bacterium]|nr:amidohydrolase family protein [Ilumatobacteraceae bacterium]
MKTAMPPVEWFVDADSHLYEPRDAFTRYIEPEFRERAVRVEHVDGQEQIMVGDVPMTFVQPLYDTVPVPGSLREVLRALDSGQITEERLTGPNRPEFVDPAARLAWMDDHFVERAVVVPSLGGVVETFMDDDAAQTDANIRAFNRWLDDDWGLTYEDRIFTTPMVSLLDVDLAVGQIEWIADHGGRFAHLRPGPAGDRSPADPVFDPFWARVEEAGIVVVLHISESGYNRDLTTRWSEAPRPNAWNISAFQWTVAYGDRPIMDTIAAFVLHNLFGRFPKLRVMSLENGSLWVPYLLAAMDKMKGMGRRSPWLGGPVLDRPSDICREHLYVSPFHEEDHRPVVELLGADRVVFGSDFPHPEGVAEPIDYLEGLANLPPDAVARIMRHNLNELLG